MPTDTQDALAIGKQLADFCNQGKNLDAINTLYADNVVSVEACDMGNPELPQTTTGIDGVRKKNQWWSEHHQVHSGTVNGPFPHGDKFILMFNYDVTSNCGPMAGQRMQMEEAGLFTVQNGKVAKEEFFYHMGG